jgi:hypothetical protein
VSADFCLQSAAFLLEPEIDETQFLLGHVNKKPLIELCPLEFVQPFFDLYSSSQRLSFILSSLRKIHLVWGNSFS